MRYLAALFFMLIAGAAGAAPVFPALTGRVVDNAAIISPQGKAELDNLFAEYEKQTTNQIVVVTVPTLNGQPIEDYGYKLGRAWGIGQKGKNNGVLFIIAPNDRKLRIEVGYGLEGVLTDANSSLIINNIVLPQFKQGNMEKGVLDGSVAIVSILSGKPVNLKPAQQQQTQGGDIPAWLIILIFIIIIIVHPRFGFLLGIGGGGFGGGGSFGGSGGGFSGGGGSFGGGGSSGSW